jgi:eukaryotic-like serine/threonine-protein kinase
VKTATQSGDVYEFGPFRLNPGERLLLRDGRPVPLAPKAFDLLVVLTQNPGRLLDKQALMEVLWPDTFVEEANLAYNVSTLRKALDDDRSGPQFIETIPTRGYRFIAPVTLVEAPSGPGRHRFARSLTISLGASALILVVATVAFRMRSRPAPADAVHLAMPVPADVTLFDGDGPVVSPDGRQIAFAGFVGSKRFLHVRPAEASAVRRIAGTEGAFLPFWSPDGHFIGFFSLDGRLKKVDLSGGAVTILAEVSLGSGASWNQEGVILIGSLGNGPIWRITESDKQMHAATRLNGVSGERGHRSPQFLPDGRRFLYVAEYPDRRALYAASVDGEQPSLILDDFESNVAYAPPGYLLYIRGGRLIVQPFDPKSLRLAGAPVSIADRVRVTAWAGRVAEFTASSRVIAYNAQRHTRLVWANREGAEVGQVGEPGPYVQIALSHDEHWLAAERGGDIWLLDLTRGGAASRFTFDPALDVDPVWSPDDKSILFSSNRFGNFDLFHKAVGAKDEQTISRSAQDKYPDDWSMDGRFIVYSGFGGRTVWAGPPGVGRPALKVFDTPHDKNEFHLSPDGAFVAFSSEESGRSEIYVASFPSFEDRRQASTAGGVQPVWGPDANELFYLDLDGRMMAVPVKTRRRLEVGLPATLFQTRVRALPWSDQYAITRDGRFLLVEPVRQAEEFDVLLDWASLLNR